MGEKIKAIALDSIRPGEIKPLSLLGKDVLMANIEGKIYAASNECTHELAFLSEGRLEGSSVVCPLHDSAFDLKTGEVLSPPAESPIPVYRVTIEDGQVYVEL